MPQLSLTSFRWGRIARTFYIHVAVVCNGAHPTPQNQDFEIFKNCFCLFFISFFLFFFLFRIPPPPTHPTTFKNDAPCLSYKKSMNRGIYCGSIVIVVNSGYNVYSVRSSPVCHGQERAVRTPDRCLRLHVRVTRTAFMHFDSCIIHVHILRPVH